MYPDQLRIEFQLSVKIHPNDPWTSHGTMQKSWMASQDTENYAYVEWIDVEEWEENGKGDEEGKGRAVSQSHTTECVESIEA